MKLEKKDLRAFKKYAIPLIGYKKVDEVTRYDLIELIKKIPKIKLPNATRTQNKTATAKEVFNYVKRCLDYALNMGYIEVNPAYGIDVAHILPKEQKSKMKAVIDEDGVKELYKKISSYEYKAGRYIMQFQALTALRNVGLYRLKWEYIDWDKKIIIYPPNTYKANKEVFRLPLTNTLIEILNYFKTINYSSEFVFINKPIKEDSFSNRLKKYYSTLKITNHSPHGWRSSFKSLARKLRLADNDTIEMQLNHSLGNKVIEAYMRDDLLEERRELLIKWENFLTS
ncbi:site-specific integrase [Caminibacter mediatlanticus TB-2]|uniref:Site-specific integrase n=1 Tax=Caminibacter mediatlanticus TB-2 TaxID=391592 RepID=A0ABX5V8S3_9BACT|nr:site-specific integrase [Caminibacter mediatlanticus TB-2]